MTIHIFANLVTGYGTAANNRGDNEGRNITPLQKIIWKGEPHTTVSAEAIRFALRRQLAESEETNRAWDETERANVWKDPKFEGWDAGNGTTFIDDDLLGFMIAEGAKEEKEAGTANTRRGVLEITRAVSVTPWTGDVTFNAASPGATPSAARQGKGDRQNPVPYGTEVHATRYQFGLAMTPSRLRQPQRAITALEAVGGLRTVAGNHGRFLFDFSPEVILLRVTHDPAPRLLYGFDTDDNGDTLTGEAILNKLSLGDLKPDELILGVSDGDSGVAQAFRDAGVAVVGVRKAIESACERLEHHLRPESA